VRDGAVDELVIELDALDGVTLAVAPVTRLEAPRRAARNGAELGVVVGERLHERRGALFDQGVSRSGRCRRGCRL
jgi:hypothetical protein